MDLNLLGVGLETKVDLLQQREIAEVLTQMETLAAVVAAQVRLEDQPKGQEREMTAVLEPHPQ